MHWATVIPAILGGNDPLQGVSAHRSSLGDVSHWHFVTYGYSELYEKETGDPRVNGFGFEMTIRVIDREFGDEPPKWVVSLLQNLARYVFRSGNRFAPGHATTLNGPIALDRKTALDSADRSPSTPGDVGSGRRRCWVISRSSFSSKSGQTDATDARLRGSLAREVSRRPGCLGSNRLR